MKGPSGPQGHLQPPPHYTAEVSRDAIGRGTPAPPAPKGESPALAVAAVCLFPLGVPAIVCGHLARRRWAKGEVTIDMTDARSVALWGLVMGYMMTAFYVLAAGMAAAAFLS